ncbi:MAG TPA: hypothetical protein GX743_11730 [Actinomycetales bacterium]|nr:hypothetical protein [Actinomycetales bacterium]
MSRAPAPIFLGSDLGVYAMARSFHEAHGVHSHTIAGLGRGFINDSSILTPTLLGADPTEEAQQDALLGLVGEAHTRGEEPVVVVNSDSQVEFVQRHRSVLEEAATVIVPAAEHTHAVADKALLAELGPRVGLSTPREVEIDATTPDAGLAHLGSLGSPFILKPAVSSEWEELTFPGKLKVYVASSRDDAASVLASASSAGFTGRLLAQELIPGDDTAGYVVTVYMGADGRPIIQGTARMLLAIHTPNLLGNMAIGYVEWFPQYAEPVIDLLTELGYRGFATVDIKVDPRTGTPYLLDVNPRPGRSNYFINIGGTNPMALALADARGEDVEPRRTVGRGVYRIVPFWLTRRYVRDAELLARVRGAARENMVHPLDYAPDRNRRREFFRAAASINHIKNLARVYPRPTETSF